jgi:hypothetical protein
MEHTIGAGGEHLDKWGDCVWWAWSLFLDPSAMPDAHGFSVRVVAAVQAIIGVTFFAVFLALVVDKVQEKMRHLKDGLTRVVEWRHTVILGYTEETPNLVRELARANESDGGGVVAILVSGSKVETEKEFKRMVRPAELRGTRVVFRAGSRLRGSDLKTVAIEAARSIILLNDSHLSAELGDGEVLQVVLGMSTLRLKNANVVAQLRHTESEKLLSLVSRGSVASVATYDTVGRLMLIFARKPGLARVYNEILGFDGSEFYSKAWEECTGRPFKSLQALFPDAVPIGIVYGTGQVELNPPANYIMKDDDSLVVLAEDDNSYWPKPPPSGAGADLLRNPTQHRQSMGVFQEVPGPAPMPEKVLFAGWRHDVPCIADLLDRLVAPGSELHVVSTCPLEIRQRITEEMDLPEPRNVRVVHHLSSCGSRRFWQGLGLETFTSCIVTSDSKEHEVIYSDASCLAVLLLIRGVQHEVLKRNGVTGISRAGSLASMAGHGERDNQGHSRPERHAMSPHDPASLGAGPTQQMTRRASLGSAAGEMQEYGPGGQHERKHAMRNHSVRFGILPGVMRVSDHLPVVCEILDPRTQRTVTNATGMVGVCDFIMTNDLMSKVLAMVSENVHVKRILDQLLGGTGTQFELLDATLAVAPGARVSFMDLSSHLLSTRKAVLCGYMETAADGADTPVVVGGYSQRAAAGCVINPSNKWEQCAWDGRSLILIVTDERIAQGFVSRSSEVYAPRASPQAGGFN